MKEEPRGAIVIYQTDEGKGTLEVNLLRQKSSVQ